jgi:apolipoprotein N-acyltransferase
MPDYTRTRGIVAGAASALALYVGTGLEPVWLLPWIAPIPVLIVTARAPAWSAGAIAFAAWAAGHVHLWPFLRGALHVPVAIVVVIIVAPAVAFALIVLASRACLRRGRPWLAALAVPAMWVSAEFAVGRLSPHGTAGNLAYSQMDVLPIVQLASITGLWGVTFLVMAVPAALAVAIVTRERRRSLVAVTALVLAAVLAFGTWRLGRPVIGTPLTIGLAASDPLVGRFNTKDRDDALDVVEVFASAIDGLAAQGARLIVLPEKLVGVTEAYRDDVAHVFADAALRNRVVVVAGVNDIGAEPKRNLALVFSARGTLAASYLKHHHIPGIEAGYVPGNDLLVLPAAVPWGVAICKDLDFPPLARRYAARGVGLMLVPAWDFVVDARQHERMAAMRGIESGFAMARAAAQGLLTVRDDRGRLVASKRSEAAPVALVATTVEVRHDATVYARTGDWFAWLCVIISALVLTQASGRPHGWGRSWTATG